MSATEPGSRLNLTERRPVVARCTLNADRLTVNQNSEFKYESVNTHAWAGSPLEGQHTSGDFALCPSGPREVEWHHAVVVNPLARKQCKVYGKFVVDPAHFEVACAHADARSRPKVDESS